MSDDAARRSRKSRKAALARIAKEPSGTAMTEKARRIFRESFYDKTDPDLPEQDRRRQADAAYRLHMLTISERGVQARRRGKPARDVALGD